MFSTTFLGHQGWLFAAGKTRVLVDPLLTSQFGHGGGVGAVYPPRVFDFTLFPAVDAVLITHEHEDHFDVPSLNRLERGIPILLSSNSSVAARTFLAEMGFAVQFVRGGENVTVGDIEIALFSPDHVHKPQGDEWDVLQFVVRDRNGGGSFTSGVDCAVPLRTFMKIKELLGQRGLWCYTNNTTHWPFLQGGLVVEERFPSSLVFACNIGKEELNWRDRWSAPAGILFCGGGWSFTGEREWLNRNAFPSDSRRVAVALAAVLPGEVVLAAAPGQTIRMAGGKIVDIAQSATFLSTPDPAEWPSREYVGNVELIEQYEPACGRHSLTPGDLAELVDGLSDFGRFLYGGAMFRGLCSLDAETIGKRKSSFALVLLTKDEREAYVLEYDPRGCRFVVADTPDPVEHYAAGLECWGSDLLATLRGEIGPTCIVFGRNRSWSYHPRELSIGAADLLWSYFHPMRRPAHFLELYRRLLRMEPPDVPHVVAGPEAEIELRTREASPASASGGHAGMRVEPTHDSGGGS